ncbi:MAG: ATP-binding cassette domain-containing protein [Nitriliruptorales bacterium]|nr:ATP-binding cassette domain-containing protein [Nitriliruptorales bacterium]
MTEVHHSRTERCGTRGDPTDRSRECRQRANRSPFHAEAREGSALIRRLRAQALVRLLGHLRPIIWPAAGAYGAAIGATLLALAIPRVLGQIIDAAIDQGAGGLAWLPGPPAGRGRLLAGAMLLLVIAVARGGLSFLQRYGTAWVGRMVAADLRRAVSDRLLRLDTAFHDKASVGQLMTRVTDDTEKVRQFAATAVAELITIAVLVAGAVAILTGIDSLLAAVALAPVPILAVLAVTGAGRLGPRFLAVQRATGGLTARLQESLTQIRIVQAFTAERRTATAYETENEALFTRRLDVARIFTSIFPTMSGILGIGSAAVLLVGGRQVLAGELSIGTLVLFNAYIFLLGQPVRRLGFFLNIAARANTSARRLYELLDREPVLVDAPDALELQTIEGRVAWRHVDFAFDQEAADPSRVPRRVLHDVSLEVGPGEHVAIVGTSGSGKTALVQLLARLYDPAVGAVELDGHDLRTLSRATIRRGIAFVEQEAFLFSASVYHNVAFARPGATRAEVEGVCRLAGAHHFVSALPEGYETLVGERGMTLSGGQRQRLALARALVTNAPVMVLDDALSAVDAGTEATIRESLPQESTIVSVAQRLSTILAADRIVMLEAGRVVEQGTHGELIAANGPYARMFAKTRGAAPDDTDLPWEADLAVTSGGGRP